MNYKIVYDKLNNLLSTDKWWYIELSRYYIECDEITVIYLVHEDNKYRLYHSELDDDVKDECELIKRCVDNITEIYRDIQDVMCKLINGGLIMVMGE